MTKSKIISLMLCIIMTLCVFVGCGEDKTPQTPDGFSKIMEEAGFEVVDVTETTETNGYAAKVLVATNSKYQIEFYELIDEELGYGSYTNSKNSFEESYSTNIHSEITGGNFGYFTLTADGNFCLVTYIANTMVYCEAKEEYKDEIKNLVEKLGY